MRVLFLFAVLVLASLVNLMVWQFPNRPVELPPPSGGKIASVSFAPFRDGQSPLTQTYPTRDQIEQDMTAIKGQVAGIRTYTSLEGMQSVPELAEKHGLTVSMGAWLTNKPGVSEAETASLIELANRYPQTIKRVIVGNEVMLRQELPVEAVIAHIDRVRAAVRQPVAYADVWEFWLKYPQIADHVDIITIHLLPYWEDEPTSVDGAMARIQQAYDAIAARFPGKTIMVGETGWPTAGRNRSAAATGLVEKARFVSAFIALAERRGFDYNVIEAFDQAWKQKLEGTVGGHWGLYGADRVAKFTLGQPVVENPHWMKLFTLSSGAAALVMLGFALLQGADSPRRALPLTLLAFVLADALVFGADRLLMWKAYPLDLAFGGVVLGLEAILALAALAAARQIMAVRALEIDGDRSIWAEMGWDSLDRWGVTAAVALGGIAAVWSLLLIFDGRYRDFPNHHMILPMLALLALGWMKARKLDEDESLAPAYAIGALFRPAAPVADSPEPKRLEAWIGRILLFGGALTLVAEGFAPVESLIGGQLPLWEALHEVDWAHPNWEAWGWAAIQAGLSVPFLAAARLSARR